MYNFQIQLLNLVVSEENKLEYLRRVFLVDFKGDGVHFSIRDIWNMVMAMEHIRL
jgi:hypothetical protein